MTLKDYTTKHTVNTHIASGGDTIKNIISMIYQAYTPELFDIIIALNGSFNSWENIPSGTHIYYIDSGDVALITEEL